MRFTPNDGSRPSLVEQARRLTGEAAGPVDPTFARAVDEAKAALQPLDLAALRARAADIDGAAGEVVELSSARTWKAVFAPLLLAACLLLFVGGPAPDTDGVRLKGEAVLRHQVLRDGRVLDGDEVALYREGDRVQFSYAADHDALVLLSVDGRGVVTVFWPAEGDLPEPIVPGQALLDGSVALDDAPGTEVFVAFFGVTTVDEASRIAVDAWEAGGPLGVVELDRDRDIATLALPKEEER